MSHADTSQEFAFFQVTVANEEELQELDHEERQTMPRSANPQKQATIAVEEFLIEWESYAAPRLVKLVEAFS